MLDTLPPPEFSRYFWVSVNVVCIYLSCHVYYNKSVGYYNYYFMAPQYAFTFLLTFELVTDVHKMR